MSIDPDKDNTIAPHAKETLNSNKAIQYWNTFDWFNADINQDEKQVLKQVGSLDAIKEGKAKLEGLSSKAKLSYEKQESQMRNLVEKI